MGRSVWRDAVLFRWALLPLVLGACGDDGGGAPPSEPITRPDGGGSKPDDDAGLPDGGEEDEDAARPDGDGGVDDDDGGFTSECEGNLTTFPAAKAAGPAFSSSVRGNELTLVYLEASCGGTRAQNYAQGLMLTTLATTGDAATPSALVNVGENICYVTRNPALIAQADDDIALFYTSNSEGTNELFFTQGSGSARQTVAAGFNEFSLAAAEVVGRALVVYANESASAPAGGAAALVLGEPGQPKLAEIAPDSAGFRPTQAALAAVGGSVEPAVLGAVAWASESLSQPGIFLRFVDVADGSLPGDIHTLTETFGTTSSVALASGEVGGAVAYTVQAGEQQQIRFRTFDAEGKLGSERRLTFGDRDVRELAMAPYSKGYVLVFRSVGAGNQGGIRAMFLDKDGNVGRERFVVPTASVAAGLKVHVAQDGRLFVLWVDPASPSTDAEAGGAPLFENSVVVARVTCN